MDTKINADQIISQLISYIQFLLSALYAGLKSKTRRTGWKL